VSSVPPDPFAVRAIALSERAIRVVVTGELDLATVPQLEAALTLEMEREQEVVLDLSELSFMDSTGVAVILGAINNAKVNGWNFSVRDAMSFPVRRVLALTGVDAILPLVEE